MKIGDIDVTNSILNLEHNVNVLQQILDYIVKKNSDLNAPTKNDVVIFQKNAVDTLKKKYPTMGISKK